MLQLSFLIKYHVSVLKLQDFGDGGAFPEVPVAQFPLGMGQKKSTSNALAVQLDSSGKIKYDAIARYGHGKDKVRNIDNLKYYVEGTSVNFGRPVHYYRVCFLSVHLYLIFCLYFLF